MNYAERHLATIKVQAFVNVMAEELELRPITVVFSGRLTRKFGAAYYEQREIRLNPHLVGSKELDDTVRHEIAHFLCHDKFGEYGHGRTWKKCAIRCGARPNANASGHDAAQVAAKTLKHSYQCGIGCVQGSYRLWRKPKVCIKHGRPMKLIY